MNARTIHRRALRAVLLGQQGGRCAYCARPLCLADATLDHLLPMQGGGRERRQTIAGCVVACDSCNVERGNLPLTDWLVVCRWRGWEPDVARLTAKLASLEGGVLVAPATIPAARGSTVPV